MKLYSKPNMRHFGPLLLTFLRHVTLHDFVKNLSIYYNESIHRMYTSLRSVARAFLCERRAHKLDQNAAKMRKMRKIKENEE